MATQRDMGAGPAFGIIFGLVLALIGVAILALEFGAPVGWVGLGALAVSALGYGVIAVLARSRLIMDHLVAGRAISPSVNGLATMAQWLSGALFLGLAGVLYHAGHDGFALVLGWSAGFVLLAVLIAPYLHKSGALTVPDFLGRRYGGAMPRLLGALVLLVVSAGLLSAGLQLSATLISRAAAAELPVLDHALAVWVTVGVALLLTLPGGMQSVSWTQLAQGLVALLAILGPAIWIAAGTTGLASPQIALGEVLGGVANAEAALGLAPGHAAALTAAGPGDVVTDERDFLALAVSLMLGTAAMPVLLQRFLTAPTVRGARASAGWALFFVVLVLITVPFYAVFARFGILNAFAGAGGTLAHDALPAWMLGWGGDLLRICGAAAGDAAAVAAACGPERAAAIGYGDIAFAPEFVLLAAPEIAGLPPIAGVMLLVGGFAAALSSIAGLALAMGNTLSHDIGYRLGGGDIAAGARVTLGKVMLAVVLFGAGALALDPGRDAVEAVGWTLGLAGSGLFAALFLGIWDRRTTGPGAAAGIVAGFGIAALYILAAVYGADGVRGSGDEIVWFGIAPVAVGVIGVPVALIVTWIVSRLTPAPDPETEDFIEEMRVARDHAIAPIR